MDPYLEDIGRAAFNYLDSVIKMLNDNNAETDTKLTDPRQCRLDSSIAITMDTEGVCLTLGHNQTPKDTGPCDCASVQKCNKVAAEIDAVLEAASIQVYDDVFYLAVEKPPTYDTLKILFNTPIQCIIMRHDAPDSTICKEAWTNADRDWYTLEAEL